MNKKRIAFGIGIVLAVLAAFTASAAATNVVYFDPDPSSVAPGETVNVELRLNSTEGVTSMEADIYFDPYVLNITDVTPGAFPNQFCWCNHGNFVAMGGVTPDWMNLPPGDYLFATYTFEGNNTGTGALTYDRNKLWDEYFEQIFDVTWLDGTSKCTGGVAMTFEKDLTAGWNLVSLPLEADDMTVGSVFNSVGGSYSALYSYDAETNNFVALTGTDELKNGVGYFINMTSAGTWTYEGGVYTQTNELLEPGLNMVGWLNCTKDIEDALSSIEGKYRYVAIWDAQTQNYEVYVPGAPSAFNDFDTMEPGVGYFVSMKEEAPLSEIC